MDTDRAGQAGPAGRTGLPADARQAVTALYQAHAVGLIRLAVVTLGDRGAAEDVVQEAFCGLYRRWQHLSDQANALAYVRSSVLNGCRTVLRHRGRRQARGAAGTGPWETAESAEASALISEEHRQVLAALHRLPDRQREALVRGDRSARRGSSGGPGASYWHGHRYAGLRNRWSPGVPPGAQWWACVR